MTKPTDTVNAASLTNSISNDGHALVKEAVRVGGVVFAEPAPGVGEFVRRGVAALGFEAGDVGGEEAVGACWVGEDGEEGDWGEGFGEEFFQGAGFCAEEGAGLCVAFLFYIVLVVVF